MRLLCLLLVLAFIPAGVCETMMPARSDQRVASQSAADRSLCAAMNHRDVQKVQAALAQGANPNVVNAGWHMPVLLQAVQLFWQQPLLAKALLEAGANPNIRDSLGNTPLMLAVQIEVTDWNRNDVLQVVRLLLDKGADINARGPKGDTALSFALLVNSQAHQSLARLLLERGADLNQPGTGKFAPLTYAAFADDTARVKTLLTKGVAVDARDALHKTALLWAVKKGTPETVQALLDAGADVNATDVNGGLPPQLTLNANGATPLQLALNAGNIAVARTLLNAPNLDVNVTKSGTDTSLTIALHRYPLLASDHRREDIVPLLLAKGAQVNQPNARGETPLMLATRTGEVELVRLLLDSGAEAKAVGKAGTPLTYALETSSPSVEMIRLLLDRGADVNSGAPLFSAVVKRDLPITWLLLDRGASPDPRDSARKTPLHWAAYNGKLDIAQVLVGKGANINAEDFLGQTPLMLAEKAKHREVAAFLKEKGGRSATLPSPEKNALGQPVLHLPIHWLAASHASAGSVRFATHAGQTTGMPPALLLKRGSRQIAERVDFSSLFAHPALWSATELNNARYQLGRSYYAGNAYQFFGLVTTESATYLGLDWYSPAASQQWQVLRVVFRLRVVGNDLELTVLHRSSGEQEGLTVFSNLPRLRPSPAGQPLLLNTAGKFVYQPDGTWRKVGSAPKFNARKSHYEVD